MCTCNVKAVSLDSAHCFASKWANVVTNSHVQICKLRSFLDREFTVMDEILTKQKNCTVKNLLSLKLQKCTCNGKAVSLDSAHCFASKWANVVTNSHVQMANFAMAFYYYICHSQLWPVSYCHV